MKIPFLSCMSLLAMVACTTQQSSTDPSERDVDQEQDKTLAQLTWVAQPPIPLLLSTERIGAYPTVVPVPLPTLLPLVQERRPSEPVYNYALPSV